MQSETDYTHSLWQRFREGDVQAFEALYRQYAPILFSYGSRLTSNESLLQDSIQEFFTRLWNNRLTVSQPDHVQAYLLSSLRRELMRQLQKDLPETLEEEKLNHAEASAEEQLIQRQQESQRSRLLTEAVRSLPARQQEAIFLKYYAHLSFQEIAEIMNISVKGVYKVIYKAIDNLKGNPFLQNLFGLTALMVMGSSF